MAPPVAGLAVAGMAVVGLVAAVAGVLATAAAVAGGAGTLVACSRTRVSAAVVVAGRLMAVQQPPLKMLMDGVVWLPFSSSAG